MNFNQYMQHDKRRGVCFGVRLLLFLYEMYTHYIRQVVDDSHECMSSLALLLFQCFHYNAIVPVIHDIVIKWKHFPRNWPLARGIHRSPVDSPHKWQWHGALMSSLIPALTDGSANNLDAGDLRRQHAHYNFTVMQFMIKFRNWRKLSSS